MAVVVATHALGRVAAIALIPAVDAQSAATAAGGEGRLGASSPPPPAPARSWPAESSAGIGAVLAGWWVLPLVAVVLVVVTITVRVGRRAFGLLSGDHLGCAEQLTEIAALLTGAALAANRLPWWA